MPAPTYSRALSKPQLMRAWASSRDSTPNAGRPGIDGVTALQFAARLDVHITALAKSIRNNQYGPSRLKAVAIPKDNSDKKRLICIPTIRDRIVQRAIVDHLVRGRKLPIYNSSSYGFIKGLGTARAIARAIELRQHFDWCLKTDIESFFDRIPRGSLKVRVDQALPSSSVAQIIKKFIDCEIKEDDRLRPILLARGIKPGIGVRQGMPLSPILANLILATFDADVERKNMPMIRYADDILLFFRTKQEALGGLAFIRDRLLSQGFTLPELSDQSKTRVFAPREPVDFLGRQLYFVASQQRYVSRVSPKQIAKIRQELEDEYNFETQARNGKNFQDAVVELSRSVSAYLGAYKDAFNFRSLDGELRGAMRGILEGIYEDVFGKAVLDNVGDRARNFLGIGRLAMPEPVNDLEDLEQ